MKEFFKSRSFKAALLFCLMLSMMVCTASAAGEDTTTSTTATIVSAFTAGFQQIASDGMSLIAAAAPIALGLAGTIFLARKAISWFKSMAK